MDVKKLEERAQELGKQIEQSVANHHTLIGRLAEIQNVIKTIEDSSKEEKKAEIAGANCS